MGILFPHTARRSSPDSSVARGEQSRDYWEGWDVDTFWSVKLVERDLLAGRASQLLTGRLQYFRCFRPVECGWTNQSKVRALRVLYLFQEADSTCCYGQKHFVPTD